MKKIISILMMLALSLSLCACSVTTTTTTSETTTDTNGKTTTTTTTETNGTTTATVETSYPEGSCGEATTDGEQHTVSVSVVNNTGEDITGIYACVTGETSWNNFLEGDLKDGESIADFLTLTYTADDMSFDFGIDDANGDIHEFEAMDISDLDVNGFTVSFIKTDSGYGWTIDPSFVK